MDNIEFNYNITDEDGRVYKDVIQSNFDLAEAKLIELLNKGYTLPNINDVNDITVNDVLNIGVETPLDTVLNLNSFNSIFNLSYIPYDLVRHSTNIFSFKYLNGSGTEIVVNEFICVAQMGRYLVLTNIDTVIQSNSIVLTDRVIAYLEHDGNWSFVCDPLPYQKNLESILFESWNPSLIDINVPAGTTEIPVFGVRDNAYVDVTNPTTIRITEGI